MTIQFSLQEFMIFLVCAFGIAAGVLLLPILWDLKKVTGILRPLVETNQDLIKKTMKTMPAVFENLGQISSNVRDTTDKLKISLPVILQEVECVTNAAKGSFEMAGTVMENMGSGINETVAAYKKDTPGYFHIIEEILQIIYRTLTSGK